MVQFIPLDITDEDSLQYVLSHIDNAIQYGEAEEVRFLCYKLSLLRLLIRVLY